MLAGRKGFIGATAATFLIFLLSAGSASAATQVGETFVPSVLGGSGPTYLQTISPFSKYRAPMAGVITSWSFQAAGTNVPQLKFKVGRDLGGNQFTIVGEDGPRTPLAGQLNTFVVSIPVAAGDVIGTYRASSGLFGRSAGSDYSVQFATGDPAPGTTFTFNDPGAGFQIDVSASLEADCDQDGRGDETQDPDVASCLPDTTAPSTTITKHPKRKTKRRKARLAFTSTESGSTFECAFDLGKFSPCTSPTARRLKRGRHNFAVRAVDAAGNADPSPASFQWKIKRKHRRAATA